MNPLQEFQNNIGEIERRLGYLFHDKQLLEMAFTHRSFINEHRELTAVHNERLEFLGDAVLGMIISAYLYELGPQMPEGELSLLRSRLVEAAACADYTAELGVGDHLLLGKGERIHATRGRDSMHANLFEAIVGAIYLDGGLEVTKHFLFTHFGPTFADRIANPAQNWKAELQDYTQRTHGTTPEYRLLAEEGPDHAKTFVVAVFVQGEKLGQGEGPSKKEAQQLAAKEAMEELHGKG
ncbi:MAG: ribonuclease III [Parachlamydiales bacterium]